MWGGVMAAGREGYRSASPEALGLEGTWKSGDGGERMEGGGHLPIIDIPLDSHFRSDFQLPPSFATIRCDASQRLNLCPSPQTLRVSQFLANRFPCTLPTI